MDSDYFKASETFVLYASDTTGWGVTCSREGRHVRYTKDMAPVELQEDGYMKQVMRCPKGHGD